MTSRMTRIVDEGDTARPIEVSMVKGDLASAMEGSEAA